MRLWLRLHRQALAAAIARLAGQPLATLLAVLVLALALALPILGAVALQSVSSATARIDTDPHVSVYLAIEASEAETRHVERALRAHPESAAVRFIAREAALQELKAGTHLGELLATLERNPLPHAFVVRTRTREPARLQALKSEWQALPRVDQVFADFEWSERLGRWVRFGNRALATTAAFLGFAVLFIVGHLIRLQVLMRREEIEVSQLVGATAADVRRPFLYHGLVQTMLAALAAVAIASGLAAWLGLELETLGIGYATEFKVVFLDASAIWKLLLGASALGWIGAWISVGRELRSFSALGSGNMGPN